MATPDEPMLVTLRQELRDGTWQTGSVRTVRGLMKYFGTPKFLTRCVLAVLYDEGFIHRIGGGGYRASDPDSPVPAKDPVMTLGDRVTSEIRQRLFTHAYPPGRLLPRKSVLAAEFYVSEPVVTEATTRLMLEGLVRHHRPGKEMHGLFAAGPAVHTARDRLLSEDIHAVMLRGGWSGADFREAVERALHALAVPHRAVRLGLAPLPLTENA
ncbi:GntR family transcriptional regulator [Streptomyces murinus]